MRTGRGVTFRTTFGDVSLVLAREAEATGEGYVRLTASQVLLHFDDVFRRHGGRAAASRLGQMLGMHVGSGTTGLLRLRDALERALVRGAIVARRKEARRIVMTRALAPEDALGPEPDPENPPSFIELQLVDCVATTFGTAVRVKLPSASAPALHPLDAESHLKLEGVVPVGSKPCVVTFQPDDVKRPVEPLPDEATPLDVGDFILTRTELALPHDVPLGTTKLFQLRRLDAVVLECEHFRDGGVMMLPGAAPFEALRPGAEKVAGVEALRTVLRLAAAPPGFSAEQLRITGHAAGDPSVSLGRAECVRALLVGDRSAFVGLATARATTLELQDMLTWAAGARGYDCACAPTGKLDARTKRAVAGFKRGFDADPDFGGALPATEDVDADFWGAMFAVYVRALKLGGVPASGAFLTVPRDRDTYPVLLSKIATGTENNWEDLNALPQNQRFIIPPPNQGWHDIHVGDHIFLPEGDPKWDLAKLDAAGYPVTFGAPGTSPDPLDFLPASPRSSGSGDHHLAHPFVDSPARRGRARAAEVVFFQPGEATELVCDPGTCDTSTCRLYDPREYALDYESPEAAQALDDFIAFELRGPKNELLAGVELLVTVADGTQRSATSDASGIVRLGDVPTGRCILQLPQVDAREWSLVI